MIFKQLQTLVLRTLILDLENAPLAETLCQIVHPLPVAGLALVVHGHPDVEPRVPRGPASAAPGHQ